MGGCFPLPFSKKFYQLRPKFSKTRATLKFLVNLMALFCDKTHKSVQKHYDPVKFLYCSFPAKFFAKKLHHKSFLRTNFVGSLFVLKLKDVCLQRYYEHSVTDRILWEFSKIFKNSFFSKLWATASAFPRNCCLCFSSLRVRSHERRNELKPV